MTAIWFQKRKQRYFPACNVLLVNLIRHTCDPQRKWTHAPMNGHWPTDLVKRSEPGSVLDELADGLLEAQPLDRDLLAHVRLATRDALDVLLQLRDLLGSAAGHRERKPKSTIESKDQQRYYR